MCVTFTSLARLGIRSGIYTGKLYISALYFYKVKLPIDLTEIPGHAFPTFLDFGKN